MIWAVVMALLPAVAGGPPEASLRVASNEQFPLAFRSAAAGPQGFFPAVFTEAARRAGYRLTWVFRTDSLTQAFSTGEIDLWAGAVSTPERRKVLYFTRPWWSSSFQVLVAAGSPVRDTAGLARKTVAIHRGPPLAVSTDSALPNALISYHEFSEDTLRSLCTGAAAAAVLNSIQVRTLLLRRPSGCENFSFQSLPHLLGAFDLSIAATFPQRAIADAIRAQIQNLAADGTMERILALHPGLEGSVPAVASAASNSYLPHFAALAIVTAAAMALYAFHQRRERLQALALARSSNVAKEQFLATVSHEIRTPMNAVLGYLDLLEDTQLTSEQKHLAADISRATTSLLTLISNILDFSRIRSGHFELARRPMDLVSLMQDVASSTVLMAEAKDLELAVFIDPSAPRTLLGDEGRLRQVLLNLCANAVKFTHAGYVRIDAHYRDGHLILAVRDTGAGIPSHMLDGIFEPFVQVDSTDTRPHEGVGLGLAIVRDLVRLMHGVISVESTDRIGSQFTIRIPLAAESPEGWITPSRLGQSASAVLLLRESANASILRDYLRFAGVETHEFREESDASAWLRKNGPTSAQALLLFADPRLLSMPELFARDVRTMGWNRGKRLILAGPISALRLLTQRSREPFHGALEWPISVAALLHMLLPAETTIVSEPPPSPLPGGLTLVVDDNPINRKIAGALLRKLGCQADVAADGQTAVEMCRHTHYQLILMDCQMPVMDGYATANLIRSQLAPRATTRIIGVSASTEDETRARCIEAGMDGYLPKPLTVASLRRLLDGLAASDAKASL